MVPLHKSSRIRTWVGININRHVRVRESFQHGFHEPYRSHTLGVPLRYRNIHLTATQWSMSRLLMNRLLTPTTYLMSGLVQTIAYIKLLTAEAYRILFISVFSAFVFGHWFFINLLFVSSVTPTGFASYICMLNLWSTVVTYFSCDSHNNLFVQSRTMCIPRIWLVRLISFIARDFPEAFFKLPISFRSFPTINMSSTYSRRIRKSPPSYYVTKTYWLACVLWNPWSTMKHSKFWHHCRGDSFNPYKLFPSRHT